MKEIPVLTCTNTVSTPIRVDHFLAQSFPHLSRSYFQKMITDHGVEINGQRTTKRNMLLRGGEQISIPCIPLKNLTASATAIDLDIIDEQEHFIVINKPSGLLVHAAASSPDEQTLVNGLLYHFQEMSQFKEKLRPGIIHRLDRDTSGLILVAKTEEGLAELAHIFKHRTIMKQYSAIVTGTLAQPHITIQNPIGRDPYEYHKMTVFGYNARHAVTHINLVQQFNGYAHIHAQIETGRTHQIRVHCASIGHGVVGDQTYGVPHHQIQRQALHAEKLQFEFKSKLLSYTAPLPNDIQHLIRTLSLPTDDQSL